MLANTVVVEVAGSDAASYCGLLLRRAGATTVLLEPPSGSAGAHRQLLHAGKSSIGLGDAGGESRTALLLAIARRADVVVRPACSTELVVDGAVDVAADPEPDASGWRTALTGSTLAVAAVAGLLGADAPALAALRQTLGDGTLFPLPHAAGADARDDAPSRGPDSAWPARGALRAADGWVVTGPTQLPPEALAALVGADPSATRAEADAHLEAWVACRPRAEVVATLQSWRTSFAPVLDAGEAAALHVAEGGDDADAPAPGADTRRLLETWLGLAPAAVDQLIADGVVVAA